MDSKATPSSPLWSSAHKQARALASESGKAAVIYHRPLDERWFVLASDVPPPDGQSIAYVVEPAEAV